MNIKDTLTIRFVLVFAAVWLVASIAIYYSSSEFRKEEFYERLVARANAAAKLLIEVEEVDAQLLQKIESANPVKLPGEKITIYNYNNQELFSSDTQDSLRVDSVLLDKIRLEKSLNWRQGDVEVIGILYEDQFDRFVVVAGAKDLYGLRKLQNLRNILIIVFFISLIIIGMAARLYAGKALEPISEVISEVNEIEITNLGKRVAEGNGNDEIAKLGITFNLMLTRLQNAFEIQKSFITNASHELRTPLTSMLSLVDVTLLRKRNEKFYEDTLVSLKEDIHGLSELTSKLLLLARVDSFREEIKPVRTDTILWQAISDVSKSYKNPIKVSISDDISDDDSFTITGHEQLLKSAFSNLIENACKFSDGRDVTVNVLNKGHKLQFEIIDQGIGIAPEDLKKLGQPFFRGQNTNPFPGSGIGINLVKKIIDIHQGTLNITSSMGSGSVFFLEFPLLKI
ncbi:MAG: HAMP domain-containing sensor histidine kinase [Cyclobacteriaceae bacterium]